MSDVTAPAVSPTPTNGAPLSAPPPTTTSTPSAPSRPTAPTTSRKFGAVKTFTSRPAAHSLPAAAPPAPAAAAPPTTTTQPTPTESSPEAGTGASLGVDSVAVVSTGETAPPTEEAKVEAPKVDAAEEARRLARIKSADRKLQEERRAFAQEKQQHAQSLQRVALIEKAGQFAKSNPLGFLQQAFGIAPQQVLDQLLTDGKQPTPQEKAASEVVNLSKKVEEYQNKLSNFENDQKRAALAQQAETYKAKEIAPLFSDATKYELTLRALGSQQAAANEVHELMVKHYQYTAQQAKQGQRSGPVTLTPQQAADMIETHLRSQRDLLTGAGKSVTPGTQQTTQRTEPTAAPKSGSPTQQTPLSTTSRQKVLPKMFSVRKSPLSG